MDKAGLLKLIARMNTKDEHFTISTETTSWKAHRKAETLTDPALFPLLQEIIEEHEGRKTADKAIRKDACFIFGRIMEKSFDRDACGFFLRRLEAETDEYILSSMLERISDWQRIAGISIPAGMDTAPILALTGDNRPAVRHSAIHALRACPGKKSRDALIRYLTQEDEKTYKYEIYYANIAMQTIGEPEDIPFLERFLKSHRPDIKLTARYAIQYIRERNAP